MIESNVSLLFQNSGTIYVINEQEQLGFRLFVDRETGTIKRPEGSLLIYEITEDGELGDRVQEVTEAYKSLEELREDGWELPWEEDSSVSFVQNDDNTVTINEPVAPTPEDETPVNEPVAPTPEDETPVNEPIAPTPEDETPVNEPVALPPRPNPVWEPLEKTASLKVDVDIQFSDKIDPFSDVKPTGIGYEKEFLGGNLSFTKGSSFTVDAPVYSNRTDAYKKPEDIVSEIPYADDNSIAALSPIPSDDEPFSLGTLTYRNDELDDESKSEVFHPLSFNLTLDDPIEASYSPVNTLITINSPSFNEGKETIGFGLAENIVNGNPLKFDTGETAPILFDFVGARQVGASEDTPLQYTFDVPDNTTAQFELFGRLYTTSEPIFENSVTVEKYSTDKLKALGYNPEKPSRGEDAWSFAKFVPNFNLKIEQAAELAGYDHFNWYQKSTSDTDKRNEETYGGAATYPWTDPNPHYPKHSVPPDSYPYYWDEDPASKLYYDNPDFNQYDQKQDNDSFSFRDRPTVNKKLLGLQYGEVEFETHLVGVSKKNKYQSESLFNFEWSSNFDPLTQNVTGYGEVTLGSQDYTLDSPKTSFYASDIILNETGGGFVNPSSLITPTPDSTLSEI